MHKALKQNLHERHLIRESIETHKQTIRDKQQQVKTLRSEIIDLRELIKKLKAEYKKACFSTIKRD